MRRILAGSGLLSVIFTALLMSCGDSAGQGQQGECSIDEDCGEAAPCMSWHCEQHRCSEEKAPAGSPAKSDVEASPCHRLVCDGEGGEKAEIDVTSAPPDNPGDCMRSSCDAGGEVVTMPADDPPIDPCMAYTCMDGVPMGMPANEGQSCASQGLLCGATGKCDVCLPPDAACTDPGPGAESHSLATAHDYGPVGECDASGSTICGALTAGVTAYYEYLSKSVNHLCVFDPRVHVKATAPVRLCEYFDCPSVICPDDSSPATLSGFQGCCVEGEVTSLEINPSCDDSQVYMTVESKGAECTGYEMDFHS
jgi:hypothetical protein